MVTPAHLEASRARMRLYAALRAFFTAEGYEEVETPVLVPVPGMEPHITAFEVPFVPETDRGTARTLYLHTSPEYAMKRLLAAGSGPIFQLCKTFRNGEVSGHHNPEFTMLEFYRPQADYQRIMSDLERALAAADRALGVNGPFAKLPYERLTVADAVLRHTGVDLAKAREGETLRTEALRAGVYVGTAKTFEDVFFHLFLQKVEPLLGKERPTFLIDYPASMASLSRLKPSDPTVAERFELYASATELANGFSELNDAAEQRRRLVQEQEERRAAGRTVYALDEPFLEAVGKMPPAGGVAVGLDRILMLLTGKTAIEDVLLFPAHGFL